MLHQSVFAVVGYVQQYGLRHTKYVTLCFPGYSVQGGAVPRMQVNY